MNLALLLTKDSDMKDNLKIGTDIAHGPEKEKRKGRRNFCAVLPLAWGLQITTRIPNIRWNYPSLSFSFLPLPSIFLLAKRAAHRDQSSKACLCFSLPKQIGGEHAFSGSDLKVFLRLSDGRSPIKECKRRRSILIRIGKPITTTDTQRGNNLVFSEAEWFLKGFPESFTLPPYPS
ncbi:hypothetical protein CEXT_19041 [Caerostris extrusa]|uniref:Uncharacterized protein n=1 Tax=Caerostris extrusa TaxID=172846 RepID=A0AAV4PAW9_CAEEX|nr:hypothetical protein CEXT_19041 [Caerostris extrusa]